VQGIPYKQYLIRPDSQSLGPRGWTPRAWVIRQRGPRTQQAIVPDKETRPTLQQANQYAIELAKKWIDARG
jgi:hypothetical protein